jgi:Uma2 family endonuclease
MVANPQRNDWHGNMNPQHDDAYENSIEDMHGILMSERDFERLISGETDYHYEWIDGVVYNMTGSSPRHSVIASRIDRLLSDQISNCGPCRVHRDQYVFIPGQPAAVPDIVLTCDTADWDEDKHLKPFKIQSPLIVVEVLSPSTERFDRTAKFARYKCCPSLEVYILVNQYKPYVEVYQRARDWQKELYIAGQIVQFDQLDLELPIDAIYEGVL